MAIIESENVTEGRPGGAEQQRISSNGGISSHESHQHTRSAADKGNLEQ